MTVKQPDDDDSQRSALYEAEEFLLPEQQGREVRTCKEIYEWLSEIFASRWFKSRYRLRESFVVHDGRGTAWARGWLDEEGVCHVSIPRSLRRQLFVLHELTHALGFYGHDGAFCATYLALTRRFMGREAAEDLKFYFRMMGVKSRRPSVRRQSGQGTDWRHAAKLFCAHLSYEK